MYEELKSEMINEYLYSKPRLGVLIIGVLIALAGVIIALAVVLVAIVK